MLQNILKRFGHVPSSALGIAVLILWSALVFKKAIEPDGQASIMLLGGAIAAVFYKPNEPKQNNV